MTKFDPIMIENLREMIMEHKPAQDAVNAYAKMAIDHFQNNADLITNQDVLEELFCQYQNQAWNMLLLTIAIGDCMAKEHIVTKIQFNTGRKYTASGQRIVAILWSDGIGTFMDHDRLIAGEFVYTSDSALFTKTNVLARYDNNKYQISCRAMSGDHAWQD